MINSKLKKSVFICFGVIIASCGIGCGKSNEMELPINKVSEIYTSYDYPVAMSLSEMSDSAELVVVGKYTGMDSTWNMARNPDNVAEEDEENYTEGRLYNFSISELWKGKVDTDSILVNHRYLQVVNEVETNAVVDRSGVIRKEATKENKLALTIHDPLFIEPVIDETYVLFLRKDQDMGNYYGAMEPFSIKISNGVAELQSNLIGQSGVSQEDISVDGGRTVKANVEMGTSIADTISGMNLDDIKHIVTQ